MGRGLFFLTLLLALCIPAAGSESIDTRFQSALTAVEAAERPDTMPDTRKALLDEAIATFRRILLDRPDLVRVRLDLARAFFLTGDDELAKAHFEHVLAEGNLPEPVAANVRRFLDQIRAQTNWTMYLGGALAPDSNIGGSSEERIIYIYGFPLRRDAEELTTSGVGLFVWAGGEYQHPVSERWRFRLGSDFSRREYRSREHDRMTASIHAGPRWLASRTTEASVLGSGRQAWVGGQIDYRDAGLRLELQRRLGARTTTTARASHHVRRYREREFLNGPVSDVSVAAHYLVTSTLRLNASVGLGRDRPERTQYRNRNRWLQGGLTLALPRGITVGGRGTLARTRYEGKWFPFTVDGSSRQDRTRSVSLSAFHRGFTLGRFSPQVVVTREKRRSTAQFHDYQRTFAELRLVRQF